MARSRWGPEAVLVPKALILSPDASATDKLVWAGAALHLRWNEAERPTAKQLSEITGIGPIAVEKSMARLEVSRWGLPGFGPVSSKSLGKRVRIPAQLLSVPRLRPSAKVLYMRLKAARVRSREPGQTWGSLSPLLGLTAPTLSYTATYLESAGWIFIRRAQDEPGFSLLIHDPPREESEIVHGKVLWQLRTGSYQFGAVLDAWLTILVEPPEAVGWGLDGRVLGVDDTWPPLRFSHHPKDQIVLGSAGRCPFGTPESRAREAAKREREIERTRRVAGEQGVAVLSLGPDDLTLETLLRKLPPNMRRRDLVGSRSAIRFVEYISDWLRSALAEAPPIAQLPNLRVVAGSKYALKQGRSRASWAQA